MATLAVCAWHYLGSGLNLVPHAKVLTVGWKTLRRHLAAVTTPVNNLQIRKNCSMHWCSSRSLLRTVWSVIGTPFACQKTICSAQFHISAEETCAGVSGPGELLYSEYGLDQGD